MTNYADAAKQLLEKQKENWEQCKKGYASLEQIEVKQFDFGDFSFKTQFNPGRIQSTAAKVDKDSIKKRKCFLCKENRPADQEEVHFKSQYIILVNPFPIFPEHFTITDYNHVPQTIDGRYGDMLELTKAIGAKYILFYNGPKCGASAPDHMHFQAGLLDYMPIDEEIKQLKNSHGKQVLTSNGASLHSIDDSLRKMIVIEGTDIETMKTYFDKIYNVFAKYHPNDDEPMMNIICRYEQQDQIWRTTIFLRRKHRSHHYFEEGQRRILLSAASVDLGGVGIIPVEEDFKRIEKQYIEEIFNEIFITGKELNQISETLASN